MSTSERREFGVLASFTTTFNDQEAQTDPPQDKYTQCELTAIDPQELGPQAYQSLITFLREKVPIMRDELEYGGSHALSSMLSGLEGDGLGSELTNDDEDDLEAFAIVHVLKNEKQKQHTAQKEQDPDNRRDTSSASRLRGISRTDMQGLVIQEKTKADEALKVERPQIARSCTATSWSKSGIYLAAAFGQLDHTGWCQHRGVVVVWDMTKRDYIAESLDRASFTSRRKHDKDMGGSGSVSGDNPFTSDDRKSDSGSGSGSGSGDGGDSTLAGLSPEEDDIWSILHSRYQVLMVQTVPSCVSSLAFHPSVEGVMAAGCLNGEVRVWTVDGDASGIVSEQQKTNSSSRNKDNGGRSNRKDMNADDDDEEDAYEDDYDDEENEQASSPLSSATSSTSTSTDVHDGKPRILCQSKVDDVFHTDAVVRVHWIPKPTSPQPLLTSSSHNPDNTVGTQASTSLSSSSTSPSTVNPNADGYYLVSSSADGRILYWNLTRALQYWDQGVLITTASSAPIPLYSSPPSSSSSSLAPLSSPSLLAPPSGLNQLLSAPLCVSVTSFSPLNPSLFLACTDGGSTFICAPSLNRKDYNAYGAIHQLSSRLQVASPHEILAELSLRSSSLQKSSSASLGSSTSTTGIGKWSPDAIHLIATAPPRHRQEIIRIVEQYCGKRIYFPLDVLTSLRQATRTGDSSAILPTSSSTSSTSSASSTSLLLSPGPLANLTSHTGPIFSCEFSPLVPHVYATAGTDGVITISTLHGIDPLSVIINTPSTNPTTSSSSTSTKLTTADTNSIDLLTSLTPSSPGSRLGRRVGISIVPSDTLKDLNSKKDVDSVSSSPSSRPFSSYSSSTSFAASLQAFAWSPVRPCVFAVADAVANLCIFDLSLNINRPILVRNVSNILQKYKDIDSTMLPSPQHATASSIPATSSSSKLLQSLTKDAGLSDVGATQRIKTTSGMVNPKTTKSRLEQLSMLTGKNTDPSFDTVVSTPVTSSYYNPSTSVSSSSSPIPAGIPITHIAWHRSRPDILSLSMGDGDVVICQLDESLTLPIPDEDDILANLSRTGM